MTDFLTALNQEKKLFSQYLLNFLQQERAIYQKFSLSDDVFERLEKFVASGKMARSAILSMTYRSLLPKVSDKSSADSQERIFQEIILPLGSALEMIHSGLLIHDDIIDQDEQRRGQSSIWQQYAELAQSQKSGQVRTSESTEPNARHYGLSQAICVADLCYYLANQLIWRATANLNSQPGLHVKKAMVINDSINREICRVILAEMLDSQMAMVKDKGTLEEIQELNLYKTARYTFSLPMVLAGHLQDSEAQTIKALELIGEKIGLIFQIQDDYLGIFGDYKKTGKPILSDLREGKKTIFYYHLLNNPKLSQAERRLFEQHFAQKKLTADDERALQILFQNKSWPAVQKELTNLQSEAENLIADLEKPALTNLLKQALHFAQNRNS